MTAMTRSPGIASGLALALIAVYQRCISPRKEYRCAHSGLHGDTGCLGFAKAAIRRHGLWRALGPIRQRFRDRHAALAVLSEQPPAPGQPPRRRRDAGTSFWQCDMAMCGLEGCSTAKGAAVAEFKGSVCGSVFGACGAINCCGN